jgi:hypothetical protein
MTILEWIGVVFLLAGGFAAIVLALLVHEYLQWDKEKWSELE